jgi:hypothetical protein
MRNKFMIIAISLFISISSLAQDTNEEVTSISIDEAAKILHLLYGPGEGTIRFGDIQDVQGRRHYGLSSDDKVLFSSDTMSLTMGTSIMLVELSNPMVDDQAINNYIQRLREGGWKHYIGHLFDVPADEKDAKVYPQSFFMCDFSHGVGMNVTRLRDVSESTLGATYQSPPSSESEDYKTYVLLSLGTHIASNNCMNLKGTEPQNFE